MRVIQPVIDNRKKNTIYLSYHRITKIITNFDIVQKANKHYRDYIAIIPDLLLLQSVGQITACSSSTSE